MIGEQKEERQPTTYTFETRTEIQTSFDYNPTIQVAEGIRNLFLIDLENFPTSVKELMIFKFEDNGNIAAKKLYKKNAESTISQKTWFGHQQNGNNVN